MNFFNAEPCVQGWPHVLGQLSCSADVCNIDVRASFFISFEGKIHKGDSTYYGSFVLVEMLLMYSWPSSTDALAICLNFYVIEKVGIILSIGTNHCLKSGRQAGTTCP